MYNSKKKYFLLFCILFLSIPFVTEAQSIKKRKGKPDSSIPQEVRHQSTQFADGLREFYSHNYTTAEEIFRNIVVNDPKSDASYYILSKIKSEQKEYYTAIDYIKKALEIDPSNVWYNQFLATLYDQVEDYKNSVLIWEKVCKKVDNNEYYLYELANAYLKLERLMDVIKTYDKMEALIGYNEELTETKKNIWLYLGNVEKAVGEYKKLVKLYPFDMRNYVTIAQIYNINEMPEKAIEILDQGNAIDSANVDIILTYISIYKSTKEKSKESYYTYLLMQQKDLNNTIFQILKERTQMIIKNNNVDLLDQGFVFELEQYCKNNPEYGEAYGLLSQLYFFNNNENKALEYSSLAIQYNDLSFETWNIYLRLLFNEKKYQEIIQKSKDVEILFPTQSQFSLINGASFLETGDTLNAKKWFNNCLIYSVDDLLSELVSETLGDIYFSENNQSEALKYWKMSQRYGNTSEKIIEKLKRIK